MLGDNLRELRVTNKYTQEQLAKKLKISKSTIGMYEQNRRTPDLETLTKIADIFNISIDYLLNRKVPNTLHHKNLTWKEVIFSFPNASQLDDEEKDVLNYYNQLSITDRRWIMGQMIDSIKKYNEESRDAPKAVR